MLPHTDTDISVPGIGIGINTRYWLNPSSRGENKQGGWGGQPKMTEDIDAGRGWHQNVLTHTNLVVKSTFAGFKPLERH